MQFLHWSWLGSAFCAGLASFAPSLQAAAVPAQKVATHYTSSASAVPPDVLKEANAEAWTNAERGPVPGLKIFAHERFGAIWLGSDQGAARFDPKANHRW